MFKRKRNGNIMVVAAMILMIFPSILILSSLGGQSIKLLHSNQLYHAEYLFQDSLGSLCSDELTKAISSHLDIPLLREQNYVDGMVIYGPYYLPSGTELDLSTFSSSLLLRETFIRSFEIEYDLVSLSSETPIISDGITSTLPYTHSLPSTLTVSLTRNGVLSTYILELESIFIVTSSNPPLGEIKSVSTSVLSISLLEN